MNAARIGVLTAEETDYSYALINVVIFSGLEIWIGIIAACVPILKSIFTRPRSSTYNSASDGHRDRGYKRTHSNSLCPNEYGASWEIERTLQRRQRDDMSGTHVERLNDDDLPLRGGLTFPGKVKRTETITNTRSHLNKSLPSGSINIEADNVRVIADISTSANMAPRL
jgi:hypothetical protein